MSKEKVIKALCGKVLNKEKYNYLTSDEANMSNEGINLQISLGLQSCKTKKDVCDLLEDIRTHERQKCLLKIALAKSDMNKLLQFEKISKEGSAGIKLCLSIIDECFQIQEQGNAKGRADIKSGDEPEKVEAMRNDDSLSSQDSSAQDNQEQEAKK